MVLALTCWLTQLDTFSPGTNSFVTFLALGLWARAILVTIDLWATLVQMIQFFSDWLSILFFSFQNRGVRIASCKAMTTFTQSSQVFSASDGAMRNSIAERNAGGAEGVTSLRWRHVSVGSPVCASGWSSNMQAVPVFLKRQSTHDELLWFHRGSRRVFHSTWSLQGTVVWFHQSVYHLLYLSTPRLFRILWCGCVSIPGQLIWTSAKWPN